MNHPCSVIAVDLGAASGRVILVHFDGMTVDVQEIHRFPNRPVLIQGHLYWNIASIWEGIRTGIQTAKAQAGKIASIGVDSWAVDYGLLDGNGELLGFPFAYRDHRTDGVMERVIGRLGQESIYAGTGIQFLPFNTLYQLVAHRELRPIQFEVARLFLMIPDLLHYWLCGEKVGERTNASTTQFWNSQIQNWSRAILNQVGISVDLLPSVVGAGTKLGILSPDLAREFGPIPVVAPATHDTASAIAAIPVQNKTDWGYISSGTWSLVGLELARPMITPTAMASNFTNEGGVLGTTRFLKNVMGLWLLQECLRLWESNGQDAPLTEALESAQRSEPFRTLINPDHTSFLAPDNMIESIQSYVRATDQPVPVSIGEITRCILESLVCRYVLVFQEAMMLTGCHLQVIHIVGGGSQNHLLNQWLADALCLPVVVGPCEATALGNAAMQLVGLGEIQTLAEVRHLILQSIETVRFEPQSQATPAWNEAVHRMTMLP
jgi:rhamnulokinase